MIDYYPELRLLHIAAVVSSGSLFLLRGIGVQLNSPLAMAAPVRYLSYSIDSVLLFAALLLVWALQEIVTGSAWLWAKVALLPVYIVLGSFALKRASSKRGRLGFFIAALAVFAIMYRIARTHDPMGGLVAALC